MSMIAADLIASLGTVRRPGDFFAAGTAELLAPLVEVDGGHRQLGGLEATGLADRAGGPTVVIVGAQATAAIPVMATHTSNARPLAARYALAVTRSRRRWKRLLPHGLVAGDHARAASISSTMRRLSGKRK